MTVSWFGSDKLMNRSAGSTSSAMSVAMFSLKVAGVERRLNFFGWLIDSSINRWLDCGQG